jgi:hypothetical protein
LYSAILNGVKGDGLEVEVTIKVNGGDDVLESEEEALDGSSWDNNDVGSAAARLCNESLAHGTENKSENDDVASAHVNLTLSVLRRI